MNFKILSFSAVYEITTLFISFVNDNVKQIKHNQSSNPFHNLDNKSSNPFHNLDNKSSNSFHNLDNNVPQRQLPTLPQYSPPTTKVKTAKKQLKFDSKS